MQPLRGLHETGWDSGFLKEKKEESYEAI